MKNLEVRIENTEAKLPVQEYIIGTRIDLEKEHSVLLARVQQIRQQLGWEPIQTGRQQRKQHNKQQ